MKKYDRITPEGTRDALFKEMKIRRKAEDSLRALCENAGYGEVTTPTIEFYDVFSGVSENELYTLTDNSGRLLALRPDSTKPIARLFTSRLKDLPRPVRIFYNQSVYKRDIKFSKKYDEILQFGVELIGSGSTEADSEAALLAAKSMRALFGDGFLIEIGHAGFISSLLKGLGFDGNEELRQAIATKNYPDIMKFASEAGEKGEILKKLPSLFGGAEIFEKARELKLGEGELKAVSEVENLFEF